MNQNWSIFAVMVIICVFVLANFGPPGGDDGDSE